MTHLNSDESGGGPNRGGRQMQGSISPQNVANPAAFNRANYRKILSTYALEDFATLRTR